MKLTQEQKLYTEIVKNAWEDENFKKELVANPIEAIENFTGKKLTIPKGKTFVVRDQTAIDRGGNNYLSRPSSYHDYPTLEPLPYQYKKYDQNFLWLISDAR